MRTTPGQLIIKAAITTTLILATFATMAGDTSLVQAKEELALHSKEKVQTMIQNSYLNTNTFHSVEYKMARQQSYGTAAVNKQSLRPNHSTELMDK